MLAAPLVFPPAATTHHKNSICPAIFVPQSIEAMQQLIAVDNWPAHAGSACDPIDKLPLLPRCAIIARSLDELERTVQIVRVLHRYQIDGISLLAYDEAGSQAADWVAWELQADRYRLRDMHFDEGDVVIDIGAHIGLFSIYLAKRWPFLKVFAFEAVPGKLLNCADNLQLNGVTNVVLSPKAIAEDQPRIEHGDGPTQLRRGQCSSSAHSKQMGLWPTSPP